MERIAQDIRGYLKGFNCKENFKGIRTGNAHSSAKVPS